MLRFVDGTLKVIALAHTMDMKTLSTVFICCQITRTGSPRVRTGPLEFGRIMKFVKLFIIQQSVCGRCVLLQMVILSQVFFLVRIEIDVNLSNSY